MRVPTIAKVKRGGKYVGNWTVLWKGARVTLGTKDASEARRRARGLVTGDWTPDAGWGAPAAVAAAALAAVEVAPEAPAAVELAAEAPAAAPVTPAAPAAEAPAAAPVTPAAPAAEAPAAAPAETWTAAASGVAAPAEEAPAAGPSPAEGAAWQDLQGAVLDAAADGLLALPAVAMMRFAHRMPGPVPGRLQDSLRALAKASTAAAAAKWMPRATEWMAQSPGWALLAVLAASGAIQYAAGRPMTPEEVAELKGEPAPEGSASGAL